MLQLRHPLIIPKEGVISSPTSITVEAKHLPEHLREYFKPQGCGGCFVCKLVAVFEALRPALRDDGTLFVNLGQSYAAGGTGGKPSAKSTLSDHGADGRSPYLDSLGDAKPRKIPTGYKPKDLIPTAWLFGIAMQRAGWYLRSDIIWAKGNPMPSSVTDRPSTSHEYILMFSKKPRYFFDMTAVKESGQDLVHNGRPRVGPMLSVGGKKKSNLGQNVGGKLGIPADGSRNLRTVWSINTTPYKGSHFAVFPVAIPDRIIRAATSERGVCGACGAPWRRVVEHGKEMKDRPTGRGWRKAITTQENWVSGTPTHSGLSADVYQRAHTVDWEPGCSCSADTVPATVLDPFCGSGTTLLAARKLGRRSIGFDLDARSVEHVGNRLGYQEVLL